MQILHSYQAGPENEKSPFDFDRYLTMERYKLEVLVFIFSASILLQILACAIYSNRWPVLLALMFVMVPMPCLYFGCGSLAFFILVCTIMCFHRASLEDEW
ncbi:hypothetical protein MKX03_005034 [Papaver bracteatum]|nr:hypothetical protein MKX03_005034 [Papaver bracteatum]